MKIYKKYSMEEGMAVTGVAVQAVEKWLASKKETLEVINTETMNDLQDKGIDIVWKTTNGDYTIEVKGDRYFKTGNFFLETISNEERNTPGAFIYTAADFLFYCFVPQLDLFIIPVKKSREWFLANINSFREARTTTPLKAGKHYTTVGRLVNRNALLRNVKGVRQFNIG